VKRSIPILALTALTIACGAPAPRSDAEAPPIAVTTASAGLADLTSSFEAGGVVRARATASIASRVMATILEVHVRPGDRVRRGDPLMTLDARELTANRTRAAAALTSAVEAARAAESDIRAAEAEVTLARASFDRTRGLAERRSATPQELDQATSAVGAAEAHLGSGRAHAAAAVAARDAAQAAVDAATVAASYAVLSAPFDGLVTDRSVDPGSIASPGAPLLTLEDPSAFRLEVRIDEARASRIAVGGDADVQCDTGDADLAARWTPARVVEIARVDPAAHSFLIKLDVGGTPDLRSGVFGRARFRGAPRRALTVPTTALIRRGQLTFVFTVDGENRARLQPVSPASETRDRTEVLAGVRDGDRVIVNPPASLSDGVRVTGDTR
jgi:RND family efflux transporter MFP subunit